MIRCDASVLNSSHCKGEKTVTERLENGSREESRVCVADMLEALTQRVMRSEVALCSTSGGGLVGRAAPERHVSQVLLDETRPDEQMRELLL